MAPSRVLLPAVFEHAPMPVLLLLAESCRTNFQHAERIAKERSSCIPFTSHRGDWLLSSAANLLYGFTPSGGKSRAHLHYTDSFMVLVEGPDAWREAQLDIGLTEIETALRGMRYHAPSEEDVQRGLSKYRTCIQKQLNDWVGSDSSSEPSWQKRLFVASCPARARALPRSWTPRLMCALARFVHHQSKSRKEVARLFWSTIAASPLPLQPHWLCDQTKYAVAERVIAETAEWSSSNRRWELKEAYLDMLSLHGIGGANLPKVKAASQRQKGQQGLNKYFGRS